MPEASAGPLVICPTMKFVYVGYVVVILIVVASVAGGFYVSWPDSIPPTLRPWIPWLPVLLLVWPLKRQMGKRLTKITILDDRLRYETGLMSKTIRTILVSRVQDVTVHQSAGQRIFDVGDLSIETAGEASRLTIPEIDHPQEIADRINALSEKRKDHLT